MFESMIEFFEKLISEFSWKRIIITLTIIGFIALIIWGYESYTKQFYLNRIQTQVEILKELSALDKNTNIKEDDSLSSIYTGLVSDLDKMVNDKTIKFTLTTGFYKAFSAFVPWLLLLILFLVFAKPKPDRKTLTGMLIIIIPSVIIGYLIPTFDQKWINYYLYPAVSFFLVVLGIMLWAKYKR